MGKLYVTFHKAGSLSADRKTTMPTIRLTGAAMELLTTGAASVKTTLAAANGPNPHDPNDGGMVTCKAVGVNVMVKAGPTAGLTAVVPGAAGASVPGYPIFSGESVTFAVGRNDVVAAIEFT